MSKYLKVQLVGSGITETKRQKATLKGLGLRRLHQEKVLQDTDCIRGMLQKVSHLVKWESSQDSKLPAKKRKVTYRLGEVAKK